MNIKNIIISHKKAVITSVVAVAFVAISVFAGISISNYNKMIAEQKAIDEKAQTAYSAYVKEFDDITSNINDSSTHDELIDAITKLSAINIDKSTITLHDGKYVSDDKVSTDITDSITNYKNKVIDWYKSELDSTNIDVENASKDDLNSAIDKLNSLKNTIDNDKSVINDDSVDEIVTTIDSNIETYTNKVADIERAEAEKAAAEEAEKQAQAQATQNSYSSNESGYSGSGNSGYSGGYSGGSYYSGNSGYSGGYSSGGSYSSSSNDYPESEGWHHTDNYGGMWIRPATPEEEARAIAEAQADGSYTNY